MKIDLIEVVLEMVNKFRELTEKRRARINPEIQITPRLLSLLKIQYQRFYQVPMNELFIDIAIKTLPASMFPELLVVTSHLDQESAQVRYFHEPEIIDQLTKKEIIEFKSGIQIELNRNVIYGGRGINSKWIDESQNLNLE